MTWRDRPRFLDGCALGGPALPMEITDEDSGVNLFDLAV